MQTKIPTLHTNEHAHKQYVVEMIDTTDPRCHNTDRLVLKQITTIKKDNTQFEREILSIDSWMEKIDIKGEAKFDHLYYSDDEHRVECLDAMIRGIEDSFNERPPHGKALKQIEALKKVMELFL